MKPIRIALLAVLFLLIVGSASADWRRDLDLLVKMPRGNERKRLLARILDAGPSLNQVVDALRTLEYPTARPDDLIFDSMQCKDGISRPFVLYVPPGYRTDRPTPLLVALHPGVERERVLDNRAAYVADDLWRNLAEREGWLALYPFGQKGASWWDSAGAEMVRDLIRRVKRNFNVDDDRVWLCGFSDGATGTYFAALTDPSDFGAAVALNGHPGLGGQSRGIPLYAPNLANLPLYAVTTTRDALYPTEKIRPALDLFVEAGGRVLYRALDGRHDIAYTRTEAPRIVRFLKRHGRDPLATTLTWEASDPALGRVHWLGIDRIAGSNSRVAGSKNRVDDLSGDQFADPEPTDYNVNLVDDRIVFGILVDSHYFGSGVKVVGVPEGRSFATDAGLVEGDVILAIKRTAINDLGDLSRVKGDLSRGEKIPVVVNRKGEEMTLQGLLPPPETYPLFLRNGPSARVTATCSGNRFRLEATRLGGFSLYLSVDLVRFDEPITVTLNGKRLFEDVVAPDLLYLLMDFLENRDRARLYAGRIKLVVN